MKTRSALESGLAGLDDVSAYTRGQTITDLVDRFRLLVELSPDGLVVHQDGRIVYANPSACRFVKVAGEAELLGQPIADFVDAESIVDMVGRIAALTTPGAVSESTEIGLVSFDGSTIRVESTSVRTTWQGRPAFQVILRDLTAQKAAEAALRYQAALVAHVSDGIIASDTDGVITSWNSAAERLYDVRAADALGCPLSEVIGTDPPADGLTEGIWARNDGTRIDVHFAVADVRDDAGAVTGHVVVCSDLTERRLAEQRYATVIASLQEGLVVVGRDGDIETVNPAAELLLAAHARDLVDQPIASLDFVQLNGAPLRKERSPGTAARLRGVPEDMVIGLREPSAASHAASTRWLSFSARPLVTGRAPHAVVLSFTDVTERLAAATALEHQATHDPLTALGNRTLVLASLTEALIAINRDGGQLSVVFIDLDHFKVVNDSLGHGVGDEVLVEVGARLQAEIRSDDVAGRLGGDEFVVISRMQASVVEVEQFAERLRAALWKPMAIGGRSLVVNASAGVTVVTAPCTASADDVLRDADIAMYRAKSHGRGRHEVFDLELRTQALRRMQLEEDLRHAITNDELSVAFQLTVAILPGGTNGVEALARWDHPTLGPISPAEFIPVAEESGLIVPLGLRVLEVACMQMARWRAEQPELADLEIGVNLSARQLGDPNLLTSVLAVLDRTGLPASALWLEITESMLMTDPESAARVLHTLHDAGIRLAIDDFGTGYSSLAYLRRFPVQVLKIDRSFVTAMNDNADDAAIVTSVITLAHTLDLRVVAEGVEEPRQLEALRALGCDFVQGYLLCRPLSAEAVLPTLLDLASEDRRVVLAPVDPAGQVSRR
jgi:diguanylate cyclase (GGDEF)-like protein/PAS domain S-box-containing protein